MLEKAYSPFEHTGMPGQTLAVPGVIEQCSGIRLFNRTIKSLVYSTDVAIIRNCNADAVLAVYPFAPEPVIVQSLMLASEVPVMCGVGGGLTTGGRSVHMAMDAEKQGVFAVVVNAPTDNLTIAAISRNVSIPLIVTVVSETDDIDGRLAAGASIINVAAGKRTPHVVRQLRQHYPGLAIIATGSKHVEGIAETIAAGANAISWTPPTNAELLQPVMESYCAQADTPLLHVS